MLFIDNILLSQAKAISYCNSVTQILVESSKNVIEIQCSVANEIFSTAHEQASKIGSAEHSQKLSLLINSEVIPKAFENALSKQNQIISVLSQNKQELTKLLDSVMNDKRQDLLKMIKELISAAPLEVEPAVSASDFLIETSVQGWQHVYTSTKDAMESVEKAMTNSIESILSQMVSVMKASSGSPKALIH